LCSGAEPDNQAGRDKSRKPPDQAPPTLGVRGAQNRQGAKRIENRRQSDATDPQRRDAPVEHEQPIRRDCASVVPGDGLISPARIEVGELPMFDVECSMLNVHLREKPNKRNAAWRPQLESSAPNIQSTAYTTRVQRSSALVPSLSAAHSGIRVPDSAFRVPQQFEHAVLRVFPRHRRHGVMEVLCKGEDHECYWYALSG